MTSSGSGRSAEAGVDLAYVDVKPILARLGKDLTSRLVLVGGQAVNFWADYYSHRVPALAREGPFTSKDIDFCGDKQAVRLCADRLRGTATVATLDDFTVNTGVVVFVDDYGIKRTIDFIDQPHGLSAAEVHRLAMPFEILDDGAEFNVMHPVHCLESRVHNTMSLPGYDTPHALKQLRAAVLCAREFLRDILLEFDKPRDVLKLNERIFRFVTKNRHGRAVFPKFGIDPFDAVLLHDALPEPFRTRRYPQMQTTVARQRVRATGAPRAQP